MNEDKTEILKNAKNFIQEIIDIRTRLNISKFKYDTRITQFTEKSDLIKAKLLELDNNDLNSKKEQIYKNHNQLNQSLDDIDMRIKEIKDKFNNSKAENEEILSDKVELDLRNDDTKQKLEELDKEKNRLNKQIENSTTSILVVESNIAELQCTTSKLIKEYNDLQNQTGELISLQDEINATSYALEREFNKLNTEHLLVNESRLKAKGTFEEYSNLVKNIEEKDITSSSDDVGGIDKNDEYTNIKNKYDQQVMYLRDLNIQLEKIKLEEDNLKKLYNTKVQQNNNINETITELKLKEEKAHSDYVKLKEQQLHMIVETSILASTLKDHSKDVEGLLNSFIGRCNEIKSLIGKYSQQVTQMEVQISKFDL